MQFQRLKKISTRFLQSPGEEAITQLIKQQMSGVQV